MDTLWKDEYFDIFSNEYDDSGIYKYISCKNKKEYIEKWADIFIERFGKRINIKTNSNQDKKTYIVERIKQFLKIHPKLY